MAMLLVTVFVVLITVQQSVSEMVQCYSEFDKSSGSCSSHLGNVEMEDCCRNPHYGYKEADGKCKSCRRASWSEWSSWSQCTVTCKEGVRQRRRRCDGIGNCADPLKLGQLQTEVCVDMDCCPDNVSELCVVCHVFMQCECVNSQCESLPRLLYYGVSEFWCITAAEFSCEQGGWREWTEWGPCSVTCGNGVTKRERTCSQPPPKCGGRCHGSSQDNKVCETKVVCPTHGSWSEWSRWGPCPRTCVTEGSRPSSQQRFRTCTSPEPSKVPPGQPCHGSATDVQDCTLPFCPVPGSWGEWLPPSGCSVTCGVGVQTNTRECNSPAPKHGGQHCVGEQRKAELCNTKTNCPVDGEWAEWSSWMTCRSTGRPITCKKRAGFQKRERFCEGTDWDGKVCNGSIVDFRSCYDIDKCKMRGNWTEWSEWGLCKPPCGDGAQRTRVRLCQHDITEYKSTVGGVFFSGTPAVKCPPLEETSQSLPSFLACLK